MQGWVDMWTLGGRLDDGFDMVADGGQVRRMPRAVVMGKIASRDENCDWRAGKLFKRRNAI